MWQCLPKELMSMTINRGLGSLYLYAINFKDLLLVYASGRQADVVCDQLPMREVEKDSLLFPNQHSGVAVTTPTEGLT